MSVIRLYKKDIKKNIKGDVFKFVEKSKKFKTIDEVYFSEIKKKKLKVGKKILHLINFYM